MADMLATIAFFWMTVNAKIEALGLTSEQEQALHQHLIPGIYLALVADKTPQAENKRMWRQRAEVIGAHTGLSEGLKGLVKEELKRIEQVAQECAQLFQRSRAVGCAEARSASIAVNDALRKKTLSASYAGFGVKKQGVVSCGSFRP